MDDTIRAITITIVMAGTSPVRIVETEPYYEDELCDEVNRITVMIEDIMHNQNTRTPVLILRDEDGTYFRIPANVIRNSIVSVKTS